MLNKVSEIRSAVCKAWLPRNALHIRFFKAYAVLVEIAATETGSALLYRQCARCLELQKSWWQELQALDHALAGNPNRPSWYFRRGQVREHMNHYPEAAEDYRHAIKLKQASGRAVPAKWYYRKGYALSQMAISNDELRAESAQAYKAAIAADQKLGASRSGIGVFHEQRGYWQEAATSYAEQAKLQEEDPLPCYHWGLAAERCWDWASANEAYQQALERPSPPSSCVFRKGYVLERLGRLPSAAQCYREALSTAKGSRRAILYRLGCTLAADQQWEAAAQSFVAASTLRVRMLANCVALCSRMAWLRALTGKLAVALQSRARGPRPLARTWLTLGLLWECAGSAKDAADAYRQGEALLAKRSVLWLARLADTLSQAGRFAEACRLFRATEPEPLLVGHAAGFRRRRASIRSCYADYLDTTHVQDKTVLFESYSGSRLSCNPYAIFLHMQHCPAYFDWTFVWVVDKSATVPSSVSADKRVLLVRREGDAYLRNLACVRFLVNNSTFPSYFLRRPEQAYLNTWHGTPLKTMGRDIKSTFMERANTARNFLHATHLLSPNPHTSNILLKHYDIKDIFGGTLLETGYPRIDLTLRSSEREREALRKQLGVPAGKKVVLYAPTWRGIMGQARLESAVIKDVLRCLGDLDCHVLFRGHYFVERKLPRKLQQCLVPTDIDTNELLAIVDLLVTDYSSICFDFLPTGRPVCFYVYDLEEYTKDRGLYFMPSDMGGNVFQETKSLVAGIRRLLGESPEPDAAYRELRARFCPHDDSRASQRAVDAFFTPGAVVKTSHNDPRRPSVLFHPGALMPNGITTSFRHLSSHLTRVACSTTSVIDTAKVARFPDRREQLDWITHGMNLLGKVGRMVVTQEQLLAVSQFNTRHQFASPSMEESYQTSYAREYRRLFGDTHFDTLVEFSGYSAYWASVLGSAPSGRKLIYQHNDMVSEWRRKYPSLNGVFRLYAWYDRIVAVSKATMDLNQRNLTPYVALPQERFSSCRNLQNPEEVLRQATEALSPAEEARYFPDDTPVFVTIGRLSTEKDHTKLIRAFSALRAENAVARLLIIGDGPLRTQLLALITRLGQVGNVHLLGQQANPFKWLNRASCFVLPSNYEGQPMVLFEALALGKPIIATDIPGNRSVVNETTALLVQNNEDALRQGMLDFLTGRVNPPVFDIAAYNGVALEEFLRLSFGSGRLERCLAA
jgi:CDP-glycerol glycerophosphotransferase